MTSILYPQWQVRCEEAVSPFASWFSMPPPRLALTSSSSSSSSAAHSSCSSSGGAHATRRPQQEEEEEDLFSLLPVEMQLEVLSRVPVEDLVRRACLVCVGWRTMTRSDALWRLVASHLFGGPDPWTSLLLLEHGTICSPAMFPILEHAPPPPYHHHHHLKEDEHGGDEESGSDVEEDDPTLACSLTADADEARSLTRTPPHLHREGRVREAVLHRLRDLRVFWPFKSARNLYYCAERGYVRMVAAILRDPSNLRFTPDQLTTAINLATARGFDEVVAYLRPALPPVPTTSPMMMIMEAC